MTTTTKTTTTRTSAKPRRRRVPKKQTFNKRVKDVMYSELETKKVTSILGTATDTVPGNIQSSGLADSAYGYHIGNIWNNNNLTITQGIKQNQRVGKQIQDCRLWLKGCVQATFHNESTNTGQYPFDVYCIVYKDKLAPNTNIPDQLKIATDGHASKITGTPLNFMLPFNRSRYVIYSNRKVATFKPMPIDRQMLAVTIPPGLGSVLQNPTIGSTNNKAFKYFNMKLPCPKTLDFKAAAAGTGSDLVANAHLGIGFYVIDGSGAALGSGQIRATVFPEVTLYFKDA